MKRHIFMIAALIVLSLLLSPISAFADNTDSVSNDIQLNIATVDNRPLSTDRVLYTAFSDINVNMTVTATTSLQQSYTQADAGDRDGVVSSTPEMEQLFQNLKQVPVVLENNNISVFSKSGGNLHISNWDDLSGQKVGILTDRVYIQNKIPKSASISIKETTNLLFEGLAANEYDFVVVSIREHETFIPPDHIANAGELESLPEYLYLNKKYAYLIPNITKALETMVADGRAEKILNNIQATDSSKKKTVLHIMSSNMQVTREEQFINKLRAPFENDLSIDWYTIELSSKRLSRAPERMAYYSNLLRQDCLTKNVAAIIVSGDDAMDFLKNYYNLFFKNVPVLFYGINDDYETVVQGYEEHFTGIAEQLSAYETVSMALELFPETKNLYIVNDYTTEGRYYKSFIQSQLEPFADSINIEYNENTDCDSLLEHINALPSDTLVFVGSYFSDSIGQYYPLKEMKKLLNRDCKVPILALHSTEVEYNSIGGKCLDYEISGEIITDMLGRILNGEDVTDIPAVTDPEAYSRWVFDKIMMGKWGINEKSLPVGSSVLNKPLSIWESDPRFAITLLILLVLSVAVVIGVSFFTIRYRKQKELVVRDAKIREVKERLERIINTAPLAFMITIDGKAVESNEYMEKHVGIKPGVDVIPVYTDPSQRDMLIEKALSRDFVENQVVSYNMLSGESHRFLMNVSSIDYDGQHGFILWAMDIEERERQKDQLNTTRHNLQTILDMLPVPMRISDGETGNIVYVNNTCLSMFGYENADDMLGRNIAEMMPPVQSNGKESHEIVKHLLDLNESINMELEYIASGGGIVETLITACDIIYNGRRSTITVIIDLTAQRKQQRMLQSAAEKERDANQLKSRFLVNMSHEIRTPMNAIIGLTEIELQKNPTRETKDIYKKINTSAKNLLEIINDILDLSKIEADKIELYNDEFELEDVLNSALLVATPRLDGKHVEFMLNASLDLPRFIVGDRTRLWQILKNFLDNSAKYTENGKIVLTVFVNHTKSDTDNIVLTFIIEDTGIGIDEEQMKKLFVPYEQIRNDAQKRYSGTGLGMAISKQLCEIMGGELEVQSIMGEGTTTIINIPFARSQNRETEEQVLKTPSLAGQNMLLVDDDELSLEIMSRLLDSCDANYSLARSGMEAMEIVLERRDRGEFFDIILLDYMMDGLNGIETARQIHLALSKAPKLLMVTAYQKLLLKHELEKNGIDDILEKPFIPTQFIRKLCVTLGYEDNAEESEVMFTRFKDVNVLLCEDYRLNQEVAAGMLAQFGIVADIAENGAQGVEILNSGKHFDLVLMDLQMPVMDGYEATRIIRADSRFDNLPIVSLTADAMKEIVDKCLELGMNDHIAKPIEFSSLHRVFLKWLPESKRVTGNKAVKPMPDMDDPLARFGGNRALYEKMLIEFTKLLPDKWDDFENAAINAEETGRFIHKLKGAAGNLSEKAIYQSILGFEASLRSGKPDKKLYQDLIIACNTSKSRILENVSVRKGTSKENGTIEEFNMLIDKLRKALENYDPAASSDIVASLEKKRWPSTDTQKLHQLCESAKKYQFESALDALNLMEANEK